MHIARLVPGVEILRKQTGALESLAEQVCRSLEETLYDEVGGNNPLIERLTRVHASIEACAQRFHGRPIFDLRGYEHYAAGGRDTVSCCDFDFPGRKGLYARWDIGSEHVYISECDLDAWAATGRTTP